jgi:hypothetical protein
MYADGSGPMQVGVASFYWTELNNPVFNIRITNLGSRTITIEALMPSVKGLNENNMWMSVGPVQMNDLSIDYGTQSSLNPEPRSALLLGGGLIMFGLIRRLHRVKA